jgi:hypothetical protein
MELRETVRPPQRYDAEFIYTPARRRNLRRTSAPTYVDYNPNLPPAAFPTLDKPRPVSDGQIEHSQSRKTDRDGDVDMDNNDEENDGLDELQHIQIHDVDNYLASNGTQNSTYAKNIERLGQIKRTSSHDSDTTWSQGDGEPNQDDNKNDTEEVCEVCRVVSCSEERSNANATDRNHCHQILSG